MEKQLDTHSCSFIDKLVAFKVRKGHSILIHKNPAKIEYLFKTPEIGCHIYIFCVPQDTKLEEFLQMEMTSEIGLFAQMPYV